MFSLYLPLVLESYCISERPIYPLGNRVVAARAATGEHGAEGGEVEKLRRKAAVFLARDLDARGCAFSTRTRYPAYATLSCENRCVSLGG